MSTRRFTPSIWLLCLAAWAPLQAPAQVSPATAGAAQAKAQPAGGELAMQGLADQAQHWVDGNLAQLTATQPQALRMEVKVGVLDTRLRLAPCAQSEVYLPPGTRLWGRARIGVRCTDGVARWNVFLPVTVKAYGKAWLVNRQIQAGEVLRAEDASEGTVDWAEEAAPVLTDASWVGSQASRAMAPGQALRASNVREQLAFASGAMVKVLAQGGGFQVSTEGQALTAGAMGKLARVRTTGGRVVSGTVVDENTIRVDL